MTPFQRRLREIHGPDLDFERVEVKPRPLYAARKSRGLPFLQRWLIGAPLFVIACFFTVCIVIIGSALALAIAVVGFGLGPR